MLFSELDNIQVIDNEQEGKELTGGYHYGSYRLYSSVSVYGNRAISDAYASAYGYSTFARSSTSTSTDSYSSYASASSDSATNY